jgi:hypothetical protein
LVKDPSDFALGLLLGDIEEFDRVLGEGNDRVDLSLAVGSVETREDLLATGRILGGTVRFVHDVETGEQFFVGLTEQSTVLDTPPEEEGVTSIDSGHSLLTGAIVRDENGSCCSS